MFEEAEAGVWNDLAVRSVIYITFKLFIGILFLLFDFACVYLMGF
jgi:hypothetical protein